jgi:hypothetical protein
MSQMNPSRSSCCVLLLLLGALAGSACVQPVGDGEGERPCPCASGWTCCEDMQLCVSTPARCEQLRPSEPLSLTATPGVRSVGLGWADPQSIGGKDLTGFEVNVIPLEQGVSVKLDGARTARVEGLRAGATYRFTVAARNALGTGPAADTGPVRLPDVPDAPTAVAAERGDRRARVTWAAPSDGGLPILRYLVTAHPSNVQAEVDGPELSTWMEGLPNGEGVSFTVRAVNAVGVGPQSIASASVVPASRPGAPRSVSATPAVRGASVTWAAPEDTGGIPLSAYVVKASPGGASLQVDGATTQATVTGLEADTAYTFTVVSRNELGDSLESPASAPIRTPTLPGAPVGVHAAPGMRSLMVTWEPPASDGGAPLTGYTVRAEPRGVSLEVGAAARSATLQDIPSTRAQTVTVTARSAVGEGPAASAEGPVRARPAPVELSQVEVPMLEGGCIPVSYTLRQPDGERADVVVEVDPEGDGTFLRARQAGSMTHDGLVSVGTSAEGAPRSFLWNRWRDVRGLAPSARIRVTATVPGTPSATRTLLRPLGAATGRCELELSPIPVQWASPVPLWMPVGELLHGDFDHDGKEDVMVLQRGSPISLLRGLGNGGFAPATEAQAASWAEALASADLDGDGWLDLVTAGSEGESTRVQVARGRGDGTFEAPVITELAGPNTDLMSPPLLLRDLDADGTPEVVLARSGTLFVLRQTGGGHLEVAFEEAVGMPGRLVGGDFDGDGREDVMMAGPSLIAWYGLGLLDFTPEHLGPLGEEVPSAKAADFNGDGHLDLAVIVNQQIEAVLQLRLGDGEGRFHAPTQLLRSQSDIWGRRAELTLGDLERNGHQDLVYLFPDRASLALLRGRGDGTFTSETVPGDRGQLRSGIADFDGSGKPDLVLLSEDGRLGVFRDLARMDGGDLGASPALADFDGDGWNDVISMGTDTQLYLHHSRPIDGLVPLNEPIIVPPGTWKLLPGRFDAGGTVDLLVRTTPRHGGAPPHLALLRGNADGTFAPGEPMALAAPPEEVITGDVDGDTDLDVVFTTRRMVDNRYLQEVWLLRGNGDGTFMPAVLVATPDSAVRPYLKDLNRDGRADLMLQYASFMVRLEIFEGRADGQLETVTWLASHETCGASALAFDDLDSNGHVDVVIPCSGATPPGVLILWGTEDFRFPLESLHAVHNSGDAFTVADLDRDGWKDVVATNGGNTVCVLRSKGWPGKDFHSEACFGTGPHAFIPLALDVDHDGVLELLLGSELYMDTTLLRMH